MSLALANMRYRRGGMREGTSVPLKQVLIWLNFREDSFSFSRNFDPFVTLNFSTASFES